MELKTQTWIFLSLLFFFSTNINIHLSSAVDTISSGQSLMFGQTLISKSGNFELGFFNPGNPFNYYLGIWYKKVSVGNTTYVWVANRDTPLYASTDQTSSELKLLEVGNLVLINSSKGEVWSTNSTSHTMNSSEVVLQDDGNLVLRNKDKPSDVFWQSFDYPTDTFLPGGRIGYNHRTKQSQSLTSWKKSNNPARGVYSFELSKSGTQLFIMMNHTRVYWTSGPWNGSIFSGVPEMKLNQMYNISYVNNENESYITYSLYNTSMVARTVMDLSGQIKEFTWDEGAQKWLLSWSQPRKECDIYAYCGAYSVCNHNASPLCKCLEGFRPKSPRDWNVTNFSGGCVRTTPRNCGDNDQFWSMSHVKLPVKQWSFNVANADKCRFVCLSNCSCVCYAYKSGCLIWFEDLLSLQKLSDTDEDGSDLYVRIGSSDIHKTEHKLAKTGVIVGSVAAALVFGFIVGYTALKKRTKRRGDIIKTEEQVASFSTNAGRKEGMELPLFDLSTIATATNEFSLSNLIGKGGFGHVYKGVLTSGEEVAIKRLSNDSRQGLQEFMTEVVLIIKLQHRNLVRLLGCCIEGKERMLIYEYMPNKSLDFFIFDKTKSVNLNWEMRFSIIIGTARGLLYLHQDSRLRIVHRDLKASNVLLDDEMNPKISDFGMARTFELDQTHENTNRVAGTYGYMSPEYATDGVFSMKSDVFSFGVLVLEIVTGEKNRGFYHAKHFHNLLGHAWKLWNDGKISELIDPSITDSLTVSEMTKCIQVGLLCVQRFPEDRPTMAAALSMLEGDVAMLHWPKQPGFYLEQSPTEGELLSTKSSKNEVTMTLLEGR